MAVLYQVFLSIAVCALLLAWRETRRMREGGNAFFILYLVATGMVATGFNPSPTPLNNGLHIVCNTLLMPLFFINVKHFTNLSLPHWRALRAFVVGVPLIVGIDAAVRALDSHAGFSSSASYIWVGYVFALLSTASATWRLCTTPRQRANMSVLMSVPIAITAGDVAGRFFDLTLWGTSPATWTTLACLGLLSVLTRHNNAFNVRPVARSALVDQVRDGLLVIDPALRIVDYNEAANGWLSTTTATLIGHKAGEYLPTEIMVALHNGDKETLVVPWWFKNKEHWFEVQIKPMLVNRRPNGHLLTLRDITRRHQAEQALAQSRDALQAANDKLQALANTDPLTGLYNRRFLFQRLAAEMDRHRRSQMTLGVLLLDLDHFKQINDQHGHPMGDRVLQATADCMRKTVRDGDFVGRIGGEEFAVLVVDATPEGPQSLAKRLCEAIRTLSIRTIDGQQIPVTTSIGSVNYQQGNMDADTLIRLADQALYEAKADGRDRVRVASYRALPASHPVRRAAPRPGQPAVHELIQ